MKLLTIANSKTIKGEKLGYLTGILYLAPHRIAGYADVCPFSTEGCRKACLYTAGRGSFSNTQESRIIKTIHFFENRAGFIEQLREDIQALKTKAKNLGLKPCVRLNGTSDLNWQVIAPDLFMLNSDVKFYDYTKDWNRKSLFTNYDLSYSASEKTTIEQIQQHTLGRIVIVYKDQPLFDHSKLVVNGDDSDLRFLDPKDCIVGLVPKGKARKDESGFVYVNQ